MWERQQVWWDSGELTGMDGTPAYGMEYSGRAYVVHRHTQCTGRGSGMTDELAEPCGKAGRYGGTSAWSTGLDGALVYSME